MELHVKIYYTQASMPSEGEWEIRRFSVGRDALTYAGLTDNITSLFPESDFRQNSICWKDSENDFISISSDEELREATANMDDEANLKIYVLEYIEAQQQSHFDMRNQRAERGRPRKRQQREQNECSPKRHDRNGKRVGQPPVWALYMRRGMRRCMARAWILANHGEIETEMRPRDLPQEWREWMKSRINERVCEARKNFAILSDLSLKSNPNAKPFDNVPVFWRRQIRQCTIWAWEKETGKHGAGASYPTTAEKGSLPVPLRGFMRRVMVNTWQAAKADIETCVKDGSSGDLLEGWKRKQLGKFVQDEQFIKKRDNVTRRMDKMRLDDKHFPECGSRRHPPFWGPHMRQCLRRCMMGAMMAAHLGEEKSKSYDFTQVRPRDLPQELRDWMKSEIQQTMPKVRQEASKREDASPADQNERFGNPRIIQTLPEFWRKNIRQCTKKSWRRSRQLLEKDQDDGQFEEMPLPLRQYMRRNMVQFWQRANGAMEEYDAAPNRGLPLQWRKAMNVAIRRASDAIDILKMDGVEDHSQKWLHQTKNNLQLDDEVRQAARNAVREAWKKHRENSAQTGDSVHPDPVPQIPVLWRQAMRMSMVKMWRVAHSGDGRQEIPEAWKNFMRRNIQLSWRKTALVLQYAEPAGFEKRHWKSQVTTKPQFRIKMRARSMGYKRAVFRHHREFCRPNPRKWQFAKQDGVSGEHNRDGAEVSAMKSSDATIRERLCVTAPDSQVRRQEAQQMLK